MASTATNLDITISLTMSGSYQGVAVLNTPVHNVGYPPAQAKNIRLTYGTGANQANFFAESVLSLVNGVGQSIDLSNSGGSYKDPFGQAAVLTSIKVLAIGNRSSTTAQTVTITGNAVTTGGIFGSVTNIVINPGEARLLLCSPIDGKTISAGTADTVTFTSNANFDMDLVIIGIM